MYDNVVGKLGKQFCDAFNKSYITLMNDIYDMVSLGFELIIPGDFTTGPSIRKVFGLESHPELSLGLSGPSSSRRFMCQEYIVIYQSRP